MGPDPDADVAAVLRDPRFGREGFERHFASDNGAGSNAGGARQSMLFRDPPVHTRLRETVSHAFTPSAVEALRPCVDTIVHALLDRLKGAPTIDVVADLAEPLPRGGRRAAWDPRGAPGGARCLVGGCGT